MSDEHEEHRRQAASRTADIIRRAKRRGFEAASVAMANAVGALDEAGVSVRPLEQSRERLVDEFGEEFVDELDGDIRQVADKVRGALEKKSTEADDGRVVSLEDFRK